MNAYDRNEMERILEEYGDMVYRMAFIQLKNRDAADDLYQEVWLKFIKHDKRIEPEEHLKAWLLRTTINCCKDYWKSSWIQKILWKEDWTEYMERNTLHMTNERTAPDNSSMDSWQSETGYVTECVQKLPEKYRRNRRYKAKDKTTFEGDCCSCNHLIMRYNPFTEFQYPANLRRYCSENLWIVD